MTNKCELDYLPLGSVVKIKGNDNLKLMIITRCNIVDDEKKKLFDYGACVFPEGVIDSNIAYFNHENIETVLFEGYKNELEKYMLSKLHRALRKRQEIMEG